MAKHFKRARSSRMAPYRQAASQHGRRHANTQVLHTSAAYTSLALPNTQLLLLAVNHTLPASLHLVVRGEDCSWLWRVVGGACGFECVLFATARIEKRCRAGVPVRLPLES